MKNDWQPQKNSAERDWLIDKHKPIVYHLAKRISLSLPFPTEMEDLVAYGQLGLIEASERFDPSRGNNFSTFAHYRIKGAIYDGLREMGAITRSRTMRFAAQANDVLMTEAADSSPVVGAAVEDEIKTTENLIDALIPIYFLSIDDPDAKELEDEKAFTAADFETRDLLEHIRKILDEMEPEEAELLKRLYFKNTSTKDLAAQMGVTKSWVSRLHARAIRHLHDQTRNQELADVMKGILQERSK
ncbi:MAG: sigma-70 family RNA polymerase sigma factor [Acidobacteriota bacterium]|nr:sigma-70 family RNA polymerase sigma factor [Acidobacteriota bacterium]